jgi:hypothetical protein
MTTMTLEWAPLWDAMKAKPDAWILTNEAMYWEMLECVPPRAMAGRTFLVGEADSHNNDGYAVYACFKKFKDDYSARYMTLAQFKEFTSSDVIADEWRKL